LLPQSLCAARFNSTTPDAGKSSTNDANKQSTSTTAGGAAAEQGSAGDSKATATTSSTNKNDPTTTSTSNSTPQQSQYGTSGQMNPWKWAYDMHMRSMQGGYASNQSSNGQQQQQTGNNTSGSCGPGWCGPTPFNMPPWYFHVHQNPYSPWRTFWRALLFSCFVWFWIWLFFRLSYGRSYYGEHVVMGVPPPGAYGFSNAHHHGHLSPYGPPPPGFYPHPYYGGGGFPVISHHGFHGYHLHPSHYPMNWNQNGPNGEWDSQQQQSQSQQQQQPQGGSSGDASNSSGRTITPSGKSDSRR
jgi:hypothetical protein